VTVRLLDIGKDLHTRVRKFFDTPLDERATPLEICQAVLQEVEEKVQPLGRGRRVFPYTRLAVRIRPSGNDGSAIDAAFADLDRRILERLEELRCDAPSSLDVTIETLESVPPAWPPDRFFSIEYHRANDARGAKHQAPPLLHITVVKGAATEPAFTFNEPNIAIGRTDEPTDGLGRMRRNRLAFIDVRDGVTETVGRAHARLRFDPTSGSYLLFDDGSSNGTAIVRDGATIPVPRLDPRGILVRSGDEIQVGRALLRIEIGEAG
jgi:FHA domain